uniref:Uncharacterized protein n=1 Tax=viral metagenome TaxID=1070528 RepID=A0A6M3KSL5_9ZZZZ
MDEKCFYQRTIQDVDWCDLDDHMCVLMGCDCCDEYENQKKELEEELDRGVGA